MRSISKGCQQTALTLNWVPFIFALFFGFISLPAHSTISSQAKNVLVFGVVPQQSSAKLIRNWGPLLKEISEYSGLTLRFATAPNIPEFEKRLAEGKYDVAYMNPYHFTVFNEAPGYSALVHAKNKRIKGILVVKKGEGIEKLTDLDGKNIAFPAPAAFAATLLTQAVLNNEGISFTPHYVGSHDSSYLAVADGLFDAGGGIIRTLGASSDETKNQLNVLHITQGFTPHAVAAHPSLDEETRQKIVQAFFELSETKKGKAALKTLNMKGFKAAKDSDWDDVRSLNISVISAK
ncbi:phosphate/phosphite/phosphonate ABC transporter substrate-binding protein [Enterovibrio norvegicus]|uniref:phosphate/phosphite/phosphonate ABC transporter substrate-binding protein n=1 Tax=Enterovibrio norvegicus TaxID=188144 RepID=UPI003551FAF4